MVLFYLYVKVGLFGYITYCKVEIKGDILANFSLDFISQLTRLGNTITAVPIITNSDDDVITFLGFAASVVVSFPLMIFPCRVSINSLFFSQAPNELHVQEPIPQNRFILITAGIVGSTVIIAILIPNSKLLIIIKEACVPVEDYNYYTVDRDIFASKIFRLLKFSHSLIFITYTNIRNTSLY